MLLGYKSNAFSAKSNAFTCRSNASANPSFRPPSQMLKSTPFPPSPESHTPFFTPFFRHKKGSKNNKTTTVTTKNNCIAVSLKGVTFRYPLPKGIAFRDPLFVPTAILFPKNK